MKEQNVWREVFFISLIIACFFVLFYIIFGQYGYITLRKESAHLRMLQRQVDTLRQENRRLKMQIQKLKTDPKTMEMEVRKRMLYGKDGEIIYQIIDSKDRYKAKTSK